jgi:putative transposase
MSRKRVKEPGRAYYHVMNRVIGKEFLFAEECKERFVQIMREVEAFSGVQVLTYCVMDNHFHLLLKVHDPKPLSDVELLGRYERYVARITFLHFKERWDRYVEKKNELGLNMLRERLMRRMNDLSAFMQELKQRFTEWFNATHERTGGGTFWSDRFKSVLVEGRCKPLSTVAAYIDLNPVRAGMVEDPKDYRWCGYAAGLSGVGLAREGIREVVRQFLAVYNKHESRVSVMGMYRVILFGKLDKGRPGKVTPEEIAMVFEKEGMLPPWTLAKQRVRWLSEGLIIGGRGFVSRQAATWNEKLGFKRTPGSQCTPDEVGWCRLRAVK